MRQSHSLRPVFSPALLAALCVSLFTLSAQALDPCGGPESPCAVDLGDYHVAQPEGASDTPRPAVLHFHGANGSGKGVMRISSMVNPILERGYVLIAPNGLDRPGPRGRGWSFLPTRPKMRDEKAFVEQVLADAVERFNLDRNRVLLTGFSIGGSHTAFLACDHPNLAAAYAPVAGNFWAPHKDICEGPVKMLHTHGWKDTTVPLEGRNLRFLTAEGIRQGDVFRAMEVWRATNGCNEYRADEFITDGSFWRRWWTRCDDGTALELALHTGGHGVPKGWATMALDWFETHVPTKE